MFSIDADKLAVDAADGDGRIEIDGFVSDAHVDPGDEDGDGILNADDSCPGIVNLDINSDEDGLDDACDPNPCDVGDARGAFYSLDQLPRPDWIETGTISQFDGYIALSPGAFLNGSLPTASHHLIELGTIAGPSVNGDPSWVVKLFPTSDDGPWCEFEHLGGGSFAVRAYGSMSDGEAGLSFADGSFVALQSSVRRAADGFTVLTCQIANQAGGGPSGIEVGELLNTEGDAPHIEAPDVPARWLLDYRIPLTTPLNNCPN